MPGATGGTGRSWLREAKREVQRRAYVDRHHSIADTVLLAGSGRSGTTWLGEIIDRHHDHRIIFEPFWPEAVSAAAPFTRGLYLRPGERDRRYVEPAREILSGRVRSRWADHQNHVRFVRRRLVKEVRVNNLLPWLQEVFPELRIVYLMRHPVAVAESQRRMGWKEHLARSLDQPALVKDHLAPALPLLRSLRTPWERFIGQWCTENLAPYHLLHARSACLVFYEDLCDHPRAAATRVLDHLGQEPDRELDQALHRPSRLVRADSAVLRNADPVDSWRDTVTDTEVERAAEIVAACGLGEVYGLDPRPDIAAGRARFGRRPGDPSPASR